MSFDHNRQFIGASECASIIGLDDYRTQIAIWDRLVNGTVSEDSPLARRGRALESALLAYYADETKHRVLAPVETRLHALGFIGATPDGLDQDEPLVIEAKAPSFRVRHLWDGEDLPARYVVQTQIQCAVFDRPEARVVVDLGDRIEIRSVPYDADLAGDIIEQVARFHRDHVVTRRPPVPDGSDSYSDWLDRRFPGATRDMRDATEDETRLALELQAARDKAEAAEAEAKRIRQELESRIGEAKGIRGAFGSITWSDVRGRESIDAAALKAAHPEIAAQFTRRSAGYRAFKVSIKGAA